MLTDVLVKYIIRNSFEIFCTVDFEASGFQQFFKR